MQRSSTCTRAKVPARAYTTRSPIPWHLTCPHLAAALRGLAASTEYSYQVVSGDASSPLLSFRTAPDASTLTAQLPHQFVIYGDLGHKVPTGSSTVMPYVTRDVRDGPPGLPRSVIDMVLHVGDLACEIPIWPFGPTVRTFASCLQPCAACCSPHPPPLALTRPPPSPWPDSRLRRRL